MRSTVAIDVPDEVYGVAWNGKTEVPTKNAIYDYLSTLSGSNGLNVAFTAQTSVNVVHNYGLYPHVSVINNTGAILIPLSIVHNSLNDFTVTFTASTTGTIVASIVGTNTGMFSYVSTSTNYTTTNSNYTIDVTANSPTITLVSATGLSGKNQVIQNTGKGVATIAPLGVLVEPSHSVTVRSNGTAWSVISVSSPLNKVISRENYLNGSTSLQHNMTTSNSGSGSSNTSASINGRYGVTIIRTGTGVTGTDRGGHSAALGTGRFGAVNMYMKSVFAPFNIIADGTATGFMTSFVGDVVSGEPGVGIYVWSANGETYKLKTAFGGTRTTYDTGITPVVGTFNTFEYWIDAAITTVVWAVNGVVVSTSTTNLPTNASSVGLRTVAGRTNTVASDQGLQIDEMTVATW